MNRRIACLAMLVVCTSAAQSRAQWYGWGWPGPYYSSTVYEGACRGDAAYMQAYGGLLESEARAAYMWQMVDNAQAEYRYRIYATRRETDEMDRLARATRRAAAAKEAAENPVPKPPVGLTEAELTSIGAIRWPEVFKDPRYQQTRNQLDRLFATRSRGYGAVDQALARQVTAASDALKAELKNQIRQLPNQEYVEAKRFVDRLCREVKMPVDQRTLAAH